MSAKLNMTFICAEGGTFFLSLDPLGDLTPLQVSNVMDNIITADAFNIKGGLRAKSSAEIITITKKILI